MGRETFPEKQVYSLTLWYLILKVFIKRNGAVWRSQSYDNPLKMAACQSRFITIVLFLQPAIFDWVDTCNLSIFSTYSFSKRVTKMAHL